MIRRRGSPIRMPDDQRKHRKERSRDIQLVLDVRQSKPRPHKAHRTGAESRSVRSQHQILGGQRAGLLPRISLRFSANQHQGRRAVKRIVFGPVHPIDMFVQITRRRQSEQQMLFDPRRKAGEPRSAAENGEGPRLGIQRARRLHRRIEQLHEHRRLHRFRRVVAHRAAVINRFYGLHEGNIVRRGIGRSRRASQVRESNLVQKISLGSARVGQGCADLAARRVGIAFGDSAASFTAAAGIFLLQFTTFAP